MVKNLPANGGEMGSFPGPGRLHMPGMGTSIPEAGAAWNPRSVTREVTAVSLSITARESQHTHKESTF